VAINAGLFADQLQITTGANSISAADPNSATPIAGTGARPAFALDAGVLSGMYVNSITFKGTEDGLDIVHRGTIGVTANVLFQVNGGFTNTGSIQAQGIAQINAVGPVSNSGLVSAAQTLTLATAGALDNSAGSLSAARLDISAASLANRGGSIEQTGAQALSLQSQSVSNAAGGQIGQTPAAGTPASGGTGTSAAAVMLADGALRISGALNNDAGRINAAGVMDLSTSNGLNNDTGTLSLRQLTIAGGNVSNQGGTLRTQGDMRIEASQVQNQGGSLTAEGRLQFSVTGINNQGGEIVQTGAQDAAITVTGPAGVLDNTQGHIASNGQNLAVSAQTLINTDGKLEHAGAGTLGITAGTLSGQRGQIKGNAAVNLSGAAINQDAGSLAAAQLTVNATTLSNRGGQISQTGTGQASITASQGMDNTGGTITSKGGAVLGTATLTNSQGRIAAEQNASITASAQLDNTDGVIAAIQNLSLAGGAVNNTRGTLQTGADAALTVGDIQNTAGSVYAGANLNTSAANVSNTGSFYAEGDQTLTASGSLTSSGVVASQGNTRITANSLQSAQGSVLGAGIKADGTLAAGAKLDITTAQSLAANGQVLATGNATLSGASVDLSGSQASAANIAATATAGDVSTRNATVSTAGALSLTAKAGNTRGLDNSSGTLSAGQLNLDVANLNNQSGKILQTGAGNTAITLTSPTGTLNNTSGRVATNSQNLSLSAQTVTNTDGTIEHAGTGTLGITASTLNGQRGKITGNGAVNVNAAAINHDSATLVAKQLSISATTLSNRAGQISQTGTGQTTLTASQNIDNTGGTIASNGNTTVSTATLDNTQGRIASSQNVTVTAGTQLNNTDGVLAANQDLTLTGGGINNTRGALQAGGNATLIVGDIQNTAGNVHAGANLGVNAANVSNTGSLYAAGNQTLNATGAVTSSGLIAAQGDTSVKANSLNSTAGSILGAGIKADGTLASGGKLEVSTTQGLTANGQVLAAGNGTLSGSSVDLSGSQVAAANITATATSGDITTRNATVSTAGALNLTAKANNAQTLNNSNGTLNAGQLHLDVANLNNQNGQIIQTGTADTTIALTSPTGALDNTSGRIATNSRNLTLAANTLTNTDGKIEHAGSGTLGITAATVNGQRGQTTSSGALLLNAGAINHDSASTTARQITIAATSLNNHAGEIIQTGTDATGITVTAALDNSAGKIASKGSTTVSAQSLNNQGGLLQAAGTSSLNVTTTAALDNSANGQIAAGGAATVNAGTLNNNQGRVTAGTTVTATATGAVNNTQGLIAANGATTATAASLDNTRGTVASVQNNVSVTTTGITTNDSGRIEALGSTTLTNGGLSNTKAAGQATAGSITGNTVGIQANGQVLSNSQGTIAAVQGVTLQTGAINNDKGLIQAGGALGINTHGQGLTNTNAAGYANGAGGISSQGAMTLDTAALNNAAGFIGAKGALTANTANVTNTAGGQVVSESTVTVTGTGFDNQGGQVQALGDISLAATGTINNAGGLVRSAGTASLAAASVVNSNTLGANLGLEGNNVAVTANAIANDNGAIRADNNATLTSSGTVNNNAGLISAGNTATVQDIAASRSLAISNTAGTIIAGQNTSIKAASLGGDGKVLSRKDLKIDLTADFNNTGEVSAANNATVTTRGTLANNGTLQAGATLDVTAATINNGVAGKMAASTLKLTATDVHTLINRGLIDSVNTQINTVTLNNLGTGRIYGDTVGIAATTVNNDAENGVAATIAARQRLDIGAATVNNRNGALIFSAGTGANALNMGGALDAGGHAIGQAGTVNNSGSTIESLGGLGINAGQIDNTNPNFAYALQGGGVSGGPVREFVTVWGTFSSADGAWSLGAEALLWLPQGGFSLGYSPGNLYSRGAYGIALVVPPGTTYSAPIYQRMFNTPDVVLNGVIYPVAVVPPDPSVWALFGLAVPTGSPPTAPKPVGYCPGSNCGNGDHSDATYVDPDPAEVAAWEAAAAPWRALQTAIDGARATIAATAIPVDGFRDYTSTAQTAVVTQSTPGRILSSGAMTLNASSALVNDQSQIIAGGALNITGQAVTNSARTISVNAQRTGSAYVWGNFNEGCGGLGGCDSNYYAYRDTPYVQDVPQTISLNVARSQSLLSPASQGVATGTQLANASTGSVSGAPGTIGTPSAAARSAGIIEVVANVNSVGAPAGGAPAAMGGVAGPGAANYGASLQTAVGSAGGAAAQSANGASAGNTSSLGNLSQAGLTIPGSQPVVIRTVAPNTVLPTASLFRTNPNPALNYVVETDPAFANYRNWLSSDYLLTAMSLDPAATQKRLGDGFYEQRLVNEQVALLTGRRFLDGYSSEEAQYLALMNAGKTFAQQYQLRPGIALSAAQMAALTSDIVWLVEQTITLPDGSTTKALVPQVYARAQAGDLDGAGTLLAGEVTNLNLTGDINNTGTVAGRSIVNLTAENVNNLGGRITGNTVNVAANTDLNNIGGQIDAANSLTATAGRDLNIASTTSSASNYTEGSTVNNFSHTGIDRVAGLYVTNPNGTLVASAGRDVNVIAGLIQSQGDATVQAVNNLNLGTVINSSSASVVRGVGTDFLEDRQSTDVGSQVQANGRLTLSAGKDINAKAANVQAGGDLTAVAGNNINITNGRQTNSASFGMTSSDGDLFNSTSSTERRSGEQANAVGSSFGGKTVTAVAGNDITVTGSNVISDAGTTLAAGNNLTIQAATNTSKSSEFKETKESGLMSSGGFGVTIGSQEQSLDQKTSGTTAAASIVGSIAGNVSVQAGNAYKQIGSDVMAPGGNIDITAKKVDIVEARETSQTVVEQKFKQSGLSFEVVSPVISAMQAIQQQSEAADKTSDGRAKGLSLANTALAAKKVADALEKGQGSRINGKDGQIATGKDADGNVTSRDANAADKAGGIDLAISIGGSESQSRQESQSDTARGSIVSAAGNVSITATGAGKNSNLTIQGSQVDGLNVQLAADNEVKLLAAQNTATQNSTNSSSSSSVGISYGTSGLMFNASGSKGSGKADGSDTSYTNTEVKAGDKVAITSGGNTTLQGATVRANQVIANIGGDLKVESLQDTSTYTSEQKNASASVSIGFGNGSASVSASNSNINSDFKSVGEQSGIKAGDGGFQVSVQGNTDLKGGVIASNQAAVDQGKNSFTTGGALTTTDVQNTAHYEAKTESISIGGGAAADSKGISGTGIGYGRDKGDASSTTSAGISGIAGNAAVRSTDAETGLKPIFDADKVQRDVDAQAQITQAFTRDAPKAVAGFAGAQATALREKGNETEAKKWDENGIYRIALHTAIGAFGGGVDGALGAAASASAADLMNAFQDNLQQGLHDAGLVDGVAKSIAQVVAGLTAAGIGAAVGGTQGAATALTVDANNRQLHLTETQKLAAAKVGKTIEEQRRLDAAACALTRCADGIPDSDPNWIKLNDMQRQGDTYTAEKAVLQKTGEFVYQPLDVVRDALTRNGEAVTRLSGAINLGAGAVGTVGGGVIAGAGAASCIETLGLGCVAVPLGIGIAGASNQQMQQGNSALLGPYQSSEGQRVLDSFNLATYPGERDPLKEMGLEVAKLGLTFAAGKYIPTALAKAEGLSPTGAPTRVSTGENPLLPSTSTKVYTESQARNLQDENRGLIFVTETPRGQQAAQDFQAGTSGAFSDLSIRKPAVPALRYDNPNTGGVNFVKFDGIEANPGGGTTFLIDAKTKLAIWSPSTQESVVNTLERVGAALAQNPGFTVIYEFPNAAVADAASKFLRTTKYADTVTVRVRNP
jgi:filamentous hemagglutinin